MAPGPGREPAPGDDPKRRPTKTRTRRSSDRSRPPRTPDATATPGARRQLDGDRTATEGMHQREGNSHATSSEQRGQHSQQDERGGRQGPPGRQRPVLRERGRLAHAVVEVLASERTVGLPGEVPGPDPGIEHDPTARVRGFGGSAHGLRRPIGGPLRPSLRAPRASLATSTPGTPCRRQTPRSRSGSARPHPKRRGGHGCDRSTEGGGADRPHRTSDVGRTRFAEHLDAATARSPARTACARRHGRRPPPSCNGGQGSERTPPSPPGSAPGEPILHTTPLCLACHRSTLRHRRGSRPTRSSPATPGCRGSPGCTTRSFNVGSTIDTLGRNARCRLRACDPIVAPSWSWFVRGDDTARPHGACGG